MITSSQFEKSPEERRVARPRMRALLVAACACVAAIAWIVAQPSWQIRKEVTIAAINNPPFQAAEPDGKVGGAIVEILELAARNADIRLIWTPATGGPDVDLVAANGVDLYAVIEARPERAARLHISDPYARAETLAVSLDGAPVAVVRRVAAGPGTRHRVWVNGQFPEATVLLDDGPGRLHSLCAGEAELVVLEAPMLDALLLRRPPSCEKARFTMKVIPELHTDYAIGARIDRAAEADLLREELGRLAREGVLDRILSGYYPLSHYRSANTFALTRSERNARINNAVLIGLLGICAVLWFSVHRLRKRAHRAIRMADLRSQFLASISHELRTPLNGVIGLASVLSITNLDRTQREHVSLIRNSGQILLKTVNEVLEFSRLEAGGHSPRSEPVDVVHLVESVVALVAPVAQQKDVELVWAVSGHVPGALLCDAAALRQVLTNLLGNAVKFTVDGTVAVNVKAQAGPLGLTFLVIDVADTGPGIPADQLKSIFDPFVRVHEGSADAVVGTGLGLSIARQLAILMGGQIRVVNNRDRGCTFSFEAALQCAEPIPVEPTTQSGSKDAVRSALVLTGRPFAGERIVRHLRNLGWLVSEFGGARHALQQAPPELSLIVVEDDPDLDWPEFLRHVRGNRHNHELPAIILCKGNTAALRVQAALPNRCLVYQQPYVSALFGAAVERLLDGSAQTEDAFLPATPATASPNSRPITAALGQLGRALGAPGRQAKYDACDECLQNRNTGLARCLAAACGAHTVPTVLVADDNPVNRKVICSLLQRLGIHPDAVADGAEAVRHAKKAVYDWVILDHQMPVMDGITAAREIRSWESENCRPRAALILSSASSLEHLEDETLSTEITDILPKPLTIHSLRESLLKSKAHSKGKKFSGSCPNRPSRHASLTPEPCVLAAAEGTAIPETPPQPRSQTAIEPA